MPSLSSEEKDERDLGTGNEIPSTDGGEKDEK